jgi:hypothetical protein
MALVKKNEYSIGDLVLDSMMECLDLAQIGKDQITISNLGNTTIPVVLAGSMIENNGAVYYAETDQAPAGTPSNGACYIKMVPGVDEAVATWTNTAPTWDGEKQGWYSPTGGEENHRYCKYYIVKATAAYTKYHLLSVGGVPVYINAITGVVTAGNGFAVTGNSSVTGTFGVAGVLTASTGIVSNGAIDLNDSMDISSSLTVHGIAYFYLSQFTGIPIVIQGGSAYQVCCTSASSTYSETLYPIGSIFTVNITGSHPVLNAAKTLYNSGSEFTDNSYAGSLVTGTWRCRGFLGTIDYYLFQRTE